MTDEIWKPIPGWPYEASNLGQIRRAVANRGTRVGKVLKQTPMWNGYLIVDLCQDGKSRRFYVARLVCEAFHGPPPSPLHQADHDDSDIVNNEADNLAWLLKVDNLSRRAFAFGERNGQCKITDAQVEMLRAARKGTIKPLAMAMGIHPNHASQIRAGLKRAPQKEAAHD